MINLPALQSSPGVSKREFQIFMYKYRKRLMLAFFVPLLLAIAISFIPMPRYKAAGVLIVRMGSEYVYQPETGNSGSGPTTNIPLTGDQIFKSEVAILNSDDLHEQVIDTIGLEKMFPDLVHPEGLSLFIGNVKDGVTKALASMGIDISEEVSEEDRQFSLHARAVELFDKRFDILLEKDSAVINVSFEHKDRRVAIAALDTLFKLYFEKRKQLYLQPRADLAEQGVNDRREKALAANRALENFKRTHAIYSLEDQRTELLDRRNEMQRLSSSIVSDQAVKNISSFNRQLDALDRDERQLNLLQKEAEIAEASYSSYASKLDDAKAYDNLQRERADSVRIIQPATVPPEPKKLQIFIILGGLFVALLITLMVAAVTEFYRQGFATPEQIERNLGLPVLAVVPMLKRR